MRIATTLALMTSLFGAHAFAADGATTGPRG